MPNLLTTCPSCRHPLEVTELHCPHCQIVIQGHFDSSPALSLNDEQWAFLKVFILSRGNLKEIERILSISYPTVRSKLDQLVEAFGESPAERSQGDRDTILQRIARKELTVSEGLALLDGLAPANREENPEGGAP